MASISDGNAAASEGMAPSAGTEWVVLVDRDDKETGVAPKLQAHRDAQLHRAFSVFVLNRHGDALLQKRAKVKYHSGGLWSNTCCGHPRPGEPLQAAARRRLREEMGFECDLRHVGSVYYELKLPNQLREHEFDHLFAGRFDGHVSPNPDEVDEICWMPVERLKRDVKACPEIYTAWLRVILAQFDPGAS